MEGLVQFVDSFLSRDTKEKYNELKEICRKSNNLGQDFFELVLKKYGLILIENGELVPYEQVDIEKQNRITDYYGIKKSEKIINAYRKLLVALHEERLLEAFSWELNNLNVQEIENLIKKKTNGKKEHKKNNKVPKTYQFRVWKQYKTEMKKKIENLDLLAGWEDEYCVPYIQVKEAGFYNVKIDDGLKGKTSEEFVAVEWNEAGYRCDIITGDLGSGKTLLLYRVAEKLLEKNNRMIFISARLSEEDNKESFRLLQVLASKKIKKRGKFVIIIDGLDELLDRGMSIKCKNLFEVASKYKATLLINCRQTLWKKLKEEYPDKVNKAWTTFKLDIKEDELNHKLNELKLSPEIVTEIMQNPLLCFWIENMIKFNKVSTDRKRFSVLNDDYSFVKEAITRLQNNEEYKYDLDTNDWPDVRCFLQKIAVALWHYGEQKVSLAGCIDTADMEKYRKFICTSFMNEMLDMDLNKSKIGDVEICAFRYKFMEKFFLIEELCQQLKNNKYDILLRVDFFNEKLKSMRTAALKAMPADVKERVINMLKAEINKEDISGSVKAQMMAIIEELNITIAVV